ncbi:MAG: uroporphyrinogen-III C-methyltransferase [Eubacterium sp.]|nr:uroporphyrinogen-III C-methyltransferase [Eubacterium sp.]
MEEKDRGICYIAGAGPGDKDLITMRLYKLIGIADVIVYDDLIGTEILDYRKLDSELIYVGKRSGKHSASQEEINSILVEKTSAGKKVLRLKGGDPFVFGRGSEECRALQENGLKYLLVPGITSSISVPELVGIPVTERGVSRSFTVITGHKKAGEENELSDYSRYSDIGGTLVFLMGLGRLKSIIEGLVSGGMELSTPVSVISSGSTTNEYILRGTVEDIVAKAEKDERVVTPAIIVVGELADRDYSCKFGKTIVVTGTTEFVNKQRDIFEAYGIQVKVCPHMKINRLPVSVNIQSFSYLAFLSQHAVRFFMDEFLTKHDIRELYGKKICCVGKATAEYLKKNYGLIADIIPEIYDSRNMAELIVNDIKEASRYEEDKALSEVLILRSKDGERDINDILSDAQISFEELALYESGLNETAVSNIRESFNEEQPDYITFGSAEGVRRYYETEGPVGKDSILLCIGRYTAEAAKKLYKNKVITTSQSRVEDFVETVLELDSNA